MLLDDRALARARQIAGAGAPLTDDQRDALALLLGSALLDGLAGQLRAPSPRLTAVPPAELPEAPPGRLAYSVSEVAEVLAVSPSMVYELLNRGELESIKAGRRRIIGRHHLEAFLHGGAR